MLVDDTSTTLLSSDLKSLLPTPKKRTLILDKFGRRVHDLTDDGTAKYDRMDGCDLKSDKERAEDASIADFREPLSPTTASAVLKTLLPKGKSHSRGTKVGIATGKPVPSLAQILNTLNDGTTLKSEKAIAADASSAVFQSSRGAGGSNLKALLPRRNKRFLKLDNFGQRVQRMEDDGTINMMKELSPATIVGTNDGVWGVDGKKGYGSLKNLAPMKREIWMKLDFKGGSVVDERRTPKNGGGGSVSAVIVSGDGAGGSNLRGLLPKRSTWTSLDFKGGQVEDERRTLGKSSLGGVNSGIACLNEKPYSNLKMLLPERTITWKKVQVLSSGSAPMMSTNARGLREERLVNIKDVAREKNEFEDGFMS